MVEVGYAARLKIEQFRFAPACFEAQDMFGEIKFRLENASAVGNRARDLEVNVKPPEPRDALPNNPQSGR